MVIADTERGSLAGYTNPDGLLRLAVPSTDTSIRLRVALDGYQLDERRVPATVFMSETVRLVKRPSSPLPPAFGPNAALTLWVNNWRTINEPRPQMGSSTSGSWTNKALMLQMLRALDLSTERDLASERDQLIALVNRAPTNPRDPNYDVQYTPDMRNAESQLKRHIRVRAGERGVHLNVTPDELGTGR